MSSTFLFELELSMGPPERGTTVSEESLGTESREDTSIEDRLDWPQEESRNSGHCELFTWISTSIKPFLRRMCVDS